VAFATLPIVRYDTVDGQAVNIVDVPSVQHEVKVAFGLEPATPAPTTTAAVAPPLTSTVDVLNGDGRPGLATTVSDALVGAGLTAGRIGGSIIATTMVTYGAGAQPDAVAVASLFSGVVATSDPALPAGRVRVVLGMGFTPPADLAARAAALKTPAAPTTDAPPTPGPQGLPVVAAAFPASTERGATQCRWCGRDLRATISAVGWWSWCLRCCSGSSGGSCNGPARAWDPRAGHLRAASAPSLRGATVIRAARYLPWLPPKHLALRVRRVPAERTTR